MNIISKNHQKVLYFQLKNIPVLATPKQHGFIKEMEAITGLTFKEFRTILINCTAELTEAYGLMGREEQWEKALQLAEINEKFEAFAQQNTNLAIN